VLTAAGAAHGDVMRIAGTPDTYGDIAQRVIRESSGSMHLLQTADQLAAKVHSPSLRYAVAFPEGSLAQDVRTMNHSLFHAGIRTDHDATFTPLVENGFRPGSTDKALRISYQTRTGQPVEIEVHTQASFEAQSKVAKIRARQALLQPTDPLYQRLDKQAAKVMKAVPIPRNADHLDLMTKPLGSG
jgi:hypothetical protein